MNPLFCFSDLFYLSYVIVTVFSIVVLQLFLKLGSITPSVLFFFLKISLKSSENRHPSFPLPQNLRQGSSQYFPTNYDINCRLSAKVLYHIEKVPIYSQVTENFCQEWTFNLVKCFLCIYSRLYVWFSLSGLLIQ